MPAVTLPASIGGAMLGARITLRPPEVPLRRIFMAIVLGLALKLLLYDFLQELLR